MLPYPLIHAIARRVVSASYPLGGVGDDQESDLVASLQSFRRSLPRSANHPAVVSAVQTASVSERIVKQ
jgi:hypothetical protein